MFQLSASVSMVLPELPLLERISLLQDRGLGVGLWDPRGLDLDAIVSTGARISIMDGFTTGNIAEQDAAEAMIASVRTMIPIARDLGSPLMNLHGAKLTADGPAAVPVNGATPEMRETAYATLSEIASLGASEGVVFGLENLNPIDHPGVPFASGADVVDLVRRVDSPHLRVNLDVYHAARGGEDLAPLLDAVADGLAAEVQLADSPTREWPGERRLDFRGIGRHLDGAGYERSVALEAWILRDAEAALDEFVALYGQPTTNHTPTT